MKKYLAAAFLLAIAAGQPALAAMSDAAGADAARVSEDWATAVAPVSAPPAAPAKLAATVVEPSLLKDLTPNAARDWKDNMITRQDAEDYSCVLSFAIGGELKSGGYLGTKALGRTLNLSRPAR